MTPSQSEHNTMLFLNHPSIYHHHRRKLWHAVTVTAIIWLLILLPFYVEAAPAPTSLVLPPSPSPSSQSRFGDNIQDHVALQRVAIPNDMVNLTRQHGGDVFKTGGKLILFAIRFLVSRVALSGW